MSSDGAVPAPGTGLTAQGSGYPSTHQALLSLIQLLSGQQLDPAAARDDRGIATAAAAALHEAGAPSGVPTEPLPPRAAALNATLRCFGYQPGAGFIQPVDARRLATRLRSLLYSGLQHCGGGTYALCFRATYLPTGRPVVLKRLKIEEGEEGVPSTALRELSLMRSLEGSAHIVQLLDALHDPPAGPARNQSAGVLYLVLESLDRDLRAHLDVEPAAARHLPFVKSAMYQVLSALAFAHARSIMHRDLKPHNILLDRRTGTVKVGDWGLGRTTNPGAPRPHTRQVQTLLYRAPELLLGAEVYSLPIDMWSCGCILAELATGAPLFRADTEIGVLMAIFQLLGTPDDAQWPGVSRLPDWCPLFPRFRARGLVQAAPQLGPLGLELLSRMLCYDPAQRITARQALAHPWFHSVRAAEEARGRAALAAAQQLRQQMQLPPRPPAGPRQASAAAAAGAASPGGASGSGASSAGPPSTPAATRGHLLSCEGTVSPGMLPPQL